MEKQRKQFEAWIAQPPSGQSVERFGSNNFLVGQYIDYSVALAWLAWQAATEVAKAAAERDSLEDVYRENPNYDDK